jgi:hypothetical protein
MYEETNVPNYSFLRSLHLGATNTSFLPVDICTEDPETVDSYPELAEFR